MDSELENHLIHDDMKIVRYTDGTLKLKPYHNAIGEIMLYHGQFRIALIPRVWNKKMKKLIIEMLDEEIGKITNIKDLTIQESSK